MTVALGSLVVTGFMAHAAIERRFQTYTHLLMQVENQLDPDPDGSAELEKELLRRGVRFNTAKMYLPVTNMNGVPEHYRDAFAHPWCILDLSKSSNDVLPLIKDLPVTHLILDRSKIADLTPVEQMPLVELSIRATPVSDLSPLKGKHLYAIDIRESRITDISPLEGMPLDMLDLSFTGISDIASIERIPALQTLFLSFCSVTDITVIARTPLTRLYLPDTIPNGMESLRKNKTITHIGYGESDFLPAAEFWAKFDAGQLKPSPIQWTPNAEQSEIPPTTDQPDRPAFLAPARKPADFAPMTDMERTYYKDQTRGKELFHFPKSR